MTVFVHIIRRLYNYEPLTHLRTLRASVFGRLVCVKGTVVRVSNIRPLCTRMAFRCLGCSHTQSLPLQHGKYATPTKVYTLLFFFFNVRSVETRHVVEKNSFQHTHMSIFQNINHIYRCGIFNAYIRLLSPSVSSQTVAVVLSHPVGVLLLLKL